MLRENSYERHANTHYVNEKRQDSISSANCSSYQEPDIVADSKKKRDREDDSQPTYLKYYKDILTYLQSFL